MNYGKLTAGTTKTAIDTAKPSEKGEIITYLSRMGDVLHDVAEGRKVVVPSRRVNAVIDCNQTNAVLTQYLHDLPNFEIITTHAAHVLQAQKFHIPGFDLPHQRQKSRTVETKSANAVIRKMDDVCKALPCCEVLQQSLLIGYGVALALLVIVLAEIVAAQSLIKSCDFLISSHSLRSFREC